MTTNSRFTKNRRNRGTPRPEEARRKPFGHLCRSAMAALVFAEHLRRTWLGGASGCSPAAPDGRATTWLR